MAYPHLPTDGLRYRRYASLAFGLRSRVGRVPALDGLGQGRVRQPPLRGFIGCSGNRRSLVEAARRSCTHRQRLVATSTPPNAARAAMSGSASKR
jgi:hypothetical protein